MAEGGADASVQDGVGLGAIGGGASELQRPGEEPQEGCGVGKPGIPVVA